MMMSGRALTPVAVLFAVVNLPPASAAPAPAGEQSAGVRFEALKKRLPRLADDWLKHRWLRTAEIPMFGAELKPRFTAEVQVARLIGPAEAKVTVVVGVSLDGERRDKHDEVVTVFLRYYRGAWTTTGFKGSWRPSHDGCNQAAHFLLLAIDRSEEK
jgi:hypothetical protein